MQTMPETTARAHRPALVFPCLLSRRRPSRLREREPGQAHSLRVGNVQADFDCNEGELASTSNLSYVFFLIFSTRASRQP